MYAQTVLGSEIFYGSFYCLFSIVYPWYTYIYMSKNYYETLGVAKTASKDEIKKAFHKLAHQHHPDKNGGDDKKFKEVNEAYQTLSDDKKRAQYDQFGSAGAQQGFGGGGQGFGGFDFSGFGGQGGVEFDMGDMGDIFSTFFNGGAGGPRRKQKGDDLGIRIDITLTDSILGITRTVDIGHDQTCETCHGKGGAPGAKIETCKKCSGTGAVEENKRTVFGMIRTQVLCSACHGEGSIPSEKCKTCKGHGIVHTSEKIPVPIPAGIQNGQTLQMSGKGNAVRGGRAGDLFITVNVITPSKVTPHVKKLLEELKKEGW